MILLINCKVRFIYGIFGIFLTNLLSYCSLQGKKFAPKAKETKKTENVLTSFDEDGLEYVIEMYCVGFNFSMTCNQ